MHFPQIQVITVTCEDAAHHVILQNTYNHASDCCRIDLRTVPTFGSAHLEILGFPMGGAYQYMDTVFARFKTIRRKQNLASALGFPKENWGNHALFRDN